MKILNQVKTKKFWKEGLGSFVLVIVATMAVRWALIEPYVIPSGSMLPSLLVHDHIFVNKFTYGLRVPFTGQWIMKFGEPNRGDVVVFRYPEDENLFYIKRIVGIPGDKVFYENGNLYLNGKRVEKAVPQSKISDFDWLSDKDFQDRGLMRSDYLHWEERLGDSSHSVLIQKKYPRRTFGPYQVPKDSYFVLGDNRDNSRDSRFWSPEKTFVPRSHLIGRAMFVWLSCTKTLPVATFLCNPFQLRWNRFFHQVD